MGRSVDVHKNDEVQVIAGKDRGKRGRVVNVLPERRRVMVEGVARVTRHLPVRPAQGSRGGQTGGLTVKEQFIDISNVQVVCPACGRATRIGHRIEGTTKSRVCKRCDTEF
jgi:large subunit ribosomal protein L24